MNPAVIRAMLMLRLRRVLSDRSNLVWLFVMPMVFSFLMGQLMGDWNSGGPPSKPRFMVYDLDGGPAADALLAPLTDNERFLLVRADTTVATVQARAAVEHSRITAALFLPSGFSEAVAAGQPLEIELFYDSDRLSSQTVRTLLDRSLLQINTVAMANGLVQPPATGAPAPGMAAAFDEARFRTLWDEPRVALVGTTLGRLQEEEGFALTKSAQHLGPAYTIFFMLMFLLLSAKELVTERHDRTLARLMVSRASSVDLVLGFFLGGMVLGLIQAAILLVLNSVAFGIDYGDAPLALALVVLLFAGVASAGSILLGSLARTGAQADGLGVAVTMVLASLGGLWWPLEVVPQFMQTLGKSLPTGQAITVFHDMIGRGYGLADMQTLFAGLGSWFAVLMVLAVWRFRRLISG